MTDMRKAPGASLDRRWIAFTLIVGFWVVIVLRFVVWLPADSESLEQAQEQIRALLPEESLTDTPGDSYAPGATKRPAAAPGDPSSSLPVIPPFPIDTMEPAVQAQITEAMQEMNAEPSDAAAAGRLGMLFHFYEVHHQAEACYRRAIALAGDDAVWRYYRGMILVHQRRLDEAAEAFRFVLDHLDGYAPAAFHLAEIDVLRGRLDDAETNYRRALESNPQSAVVLRGLGGVYLGRGNDAEAVDWLSRAIAVEPQYGEARYLLGRALQRLGRSDEALEQFQLAEAQREHAPTIDDPLTERLASAATGAVYALDHGTKLLNDGDYDGAIMLLEEAIRLNPQLAEAHTNLGTAYLQVGLFEEAQRRLRDALEIKPSYLQAQYNLGVIARRMGKNDEAIDAFRTVIAIHPGYFEAQYGLGVVLLQTGRANEAIEHLTAAIDIRPRDARTYKQAAKCLERLGRYGDALDQLRLGAQRLPHDLSLQDRIAWLLATSPDDSLRNGVEALQIARRVCEGTDYREPQALATLAAAKSESGDVSGAQATAEQALGLSRSMGKSELSSQIAGQVEAYREGRSVRDDPAGEDADGGSS